MTRCTPGLPALLLSGVCGALLVTAPALAADKMSAEQRREMDAIRSFRPTTVITTDDRAARAAAAAVAGEVLRAADPRPSVAAPSVPMPMPRPLAIAMSPDAMDVEMTGAIAREPAVRDIENFCAAIAVPANKLQEDWRLRRLELAELRIARRVEELEARSAELKGWLDKREEIVGRAHDRLVQIYERMRPETAAQQIATLDDEVALGLMSKIRPGAASAILNEMDRLRAARLTEMLGRINGVRPDGSRT